MKRKYEDEEVERWGKDCMDRLLIACIGEKEFGKMKRKRQKVKDSMKSSFFKNESDQSEFLDLLESIEESQIIQIMNISRDINKEIAIYSTGQLLECKNEGCGEIISVLHQDYDSHNQLKYKCPGCKKRVRRRKCTDCDVVFISSGFTGFSCPRCEEDLCAKCNENANYCIACDQIHCKYCIRNKCKCCQKEFCDFYEDESYEWNLQDIWPNFVVGGCAICGGKICENCISMPAVYNLKPGFVNNCICNECFKQHKDIFKHKE